MYVDVVVRILISNMYLFNFFTEWKKSLKILGNKRCKFHPIVSEVSAFVGNSVNLVLKLNIALKIITRAGDIGNPCINFVYHESSLLQGILILCTPV